MNKINKKLPYSATYLRVSTEDQTYGLSIDVQKNLCQKKAEAEGYEVLEVINDEGISGYKNDRPGLIHLKELIENGVIKAVVALESSRLFRNTESHIGFMNLAFKYGIEILYVSQASPQNNAMSKMSDTFIAAANEFHRNNTSDKVKTTLYAKAEAGYSPAPTPLGYKNDSNSDLNAPSYARRIIT